MSAGRDERGRQASEHRSDAGAPGTDAAPAQDRPQIVVGVDGSEPSERALIWAAETAARNNAALIIAHGGESPSKAEQEREELSEFSRGLLREAVATAVDATGVSEVSTVLSEDPPADVLLGMSETADMIVVGTHGKGWIVGALLGSVTSRVAAHAHCPVIVVPEGWRAPEAEDVRAVTVGVSPSPSGHDALEFAFAEAERRGVPLLAVRSWAEFDWTTPTRSFLSGSNDSLRHEQQDLLTTLVEAAWKRHPTVEVAIELSTEPVYRALHAAAARADLLVLGCRHADDYRFSRLGPIASRLLHSSACPVAIVGHPADAEQAGHPAADEQVPAQVRPEPDPTGADSDVTVTAPS